MEVKDKIIITLLAKIVGHLEGIPSDEVLKAVKEATKPKEKTEPAPDPQVVDYLYGLYPTKCPIRGSATGKCAKNKRQIETLLKTKTKEEIEETIKWYVEDCRQNKTYIKNFSTFLNQFPEAPTKTKPATQQDDGGTNILNDPLFKMWAKQE